MSRTIFVTGVSRGIGHGLAAHWLDAGCTVIGISRGTPEGLVGRDGFRFRSLDLTDENAIGPGVAALLEGVARLDLAVLNAGVLSEIRDLQETALDELRRVVDVNLWANKLVIDALLAAVPEIGQVVTISSGAAVNGNRGWGAYSISKAALNMLTRLYAAERPDIHFAAFAPGLVDTAMQEHLCSLPDDPRFPAIDVLKSRRHTPDMPTPEEAAARLAAAMERLPQRVESGTFTDIRTLEG